MNFNLGTNYKSSPNWYKLSGRYTLPSRNKYWDDKDYPVLKDSDNIKVFHGFRDIEDAISACKNGISGKSRVGRTYSYEADNNPKGLFVSSNLATAAYFGATIIEFNAKLSELEAPVWPGGSFTPQGRMAEYFSGNRIKREEARKKAREKAMTRDLPQIGQSDRPELADSLLLRGENQALFIGHLNPNRIVRVWTRGNYGDLEPLNRRYFLKQYDKNVKMPQYRDSWYADRRFFRVDEEFDPNKLIQGLVDKYGKRYTFDEAKKVIIRGLGHDNVKLMQDNLNNYIWPKQMPAALRWLGKEYKLYKANKDV